MLYAPAKTGNDHKTIRSCSDVKSILFLNHLKTEHTKNKANINTKSRHTFMHIYQDLEAFDDFMNKTHQVERSNSERQNGMSGGGDREL